MQRIVIVGPPGSGKTTVARAISAALDLPHTELDALWWDPNWTEAGEEKFTRRVDPVTRQSHWVVDGNYFDVGAPETIWSRADTMLWLELPLRVTLPRVLRRTVARGITHTELWSGNRESLRLMLRPDSIVRHAIRAHPVYNQKYAEVQAENSQSHLTWIRLSTPRAVRQWMAELRQQSLRAQSVPPTSP
jgi:adenylate kinase family enzyme